MLYEGRGKEILNISAVLVMTEKVAFSCKVQGQFADQFVGMVEGGELECCRNSYLAASIFLVK